MEQEKVIIGQVTYELQRTFQGTRSLVELMAERLVPKIPDSQSVDGEDSHAV